MRMLRPFLIAQAKLKLAGRNTDAKGTALLNYVKSEPVKNLFATKVFDRLRGEDAKEQTDLTNRNKRRTVLYGELETLMSLVQAEIDRILRSDDDEEAVA
jgi:hypothetical protein